MGSTGYLIVPNFYAPKCNRYIEESSSPKIHAISYNRCNFKCNYCNFYIRKENATYYSWEDSQKFESKISDLLKTGNSFKFTGGEPTLNKNLERDLKIVRKKGGIIYLDSNCSLSTTIKDLINKKLVDVLGVSLKGLTVDESISRSGIKSQKLCWDNVWDCIEFATKNRDVEVIVTYVCNQFFSYDKLEYFAELLEKYPNVYMKINNYQTDNGLEKNGVSPYSAALLEEHIIRFLSKHPQWKKRIILIHNSSAVQDFSKVRLF